MNSDVSQLDPPPGKVWRPVVVELVEPIRDALRAEEEGTVAWSDKTSVDCLFDKAQERVEVAGDVEQPDWLAVNAKLRPGKDLKEFVESPKPSRQSEKGVGKFGHLRFSFVHRLDNDQFGE